MGAVLAKATVSILASLLSSLTPELVSAIVSRIKARVPSIKGVLHADELEKLILKNLGFSSLPAMVVAGLSYFAVHDGDYIKNSAIAYFVSATLGLVISAVRKAYAGVDPSLVEPLPKAATLPASAAPALAKAENVPVEAKSVAGPCPAGECRFSGRIIDPLS